MDQFTKFSIASVQVDSWFSNAIDNTCIDDAGRDPNPDATSTYSMNVANEHASWPNDGVAKTFETQLARWELGR